MRKSWFNGFQLYRLCLFRFKLYCINYIRYNEFIMLLILTFYKLFVSQPMSANRFVIILFSSGSQTPGSSGFTGSRPSGSSGFSGFTGTRPSYSSESDFGPSGISLTSVDFLVTGILIGLSVIERRQKQISRPSSCVRKPFSFASYLR